MLAVNYSPWKVFFISGTEAAPHKQENKTWDYKGMNNKGWMKCGGINGVFCMFMKICNVSAVWSSHSQPSRQWNNDKSSKPGNHVIAWDKVSTEWARKWVKLHLTAPKMWKFVFMISKSKKNKQKKSLTLQPPPPQEPQTDHDHFTPTDQLPTASHWQKHLGLKIPPTGNSAEAETICIWHNAVVRLSDCDTFAVKVF